MNRKKGHNYEKIFTFYTCYFIDSVNTQTKFKTTYYKNATGDIMWWVKVTGTFTYGNGTSKCTRAIGSADAVGSTFRQEKNIPIKMDIEVRSM
ncbi:MAG: hypothetical protein RSF67_07845, partial [Clostridia bacterium]